MLWMIIAFVLIAICVAGCLIYCSNYKKNIETTIGNAEDKAREIIDEALKTAETKKREGLLEVKEESIRTKNELDKEIKERRAEAQRYERRVQQKEESVDKKADSLEKKEAGLTAREEELAKQREVVARLSEERVQELERISGLTSEQAKEHLLKIVEDEVKHETAVMIKEMESRAKEEAECFHNNYAIQVNEKEHLSRKLLRAEKLIAAMKADLLLAASGHCCGICARKTECADVAQVACCSAFRYYKTEEE